MLLFRAQASTSAEQTPLRKLDTGVIHGREHTRTADHTRAPQHATINIKINHLSHMYIHSLNPFTINSWRQAGRRGTFAGKGMLNAEEMVRGRAE